MISPFSQHSGVGTPLFNAARSSPAAGAEAGDQLSIAFTPIPVLIFTTLAATLETIQIQLRIN